MHDIGRLAILRAFPEEYMRMVSAIEEYQFDLLRCEKDLFDIAGQPTPAGSDLRLHDSDDQRRPFQLQRAADHR